MPPVTWRKSSRTPTRFPAWNERSHRMRMNSWFSIVISAALTSASPLAAEPGPVAIEVEKEQVRFLAGNELVGVYLTGPSHFRPHMRAVHAPGGVPLTISRPDAGHPHHRFLWFCHGQVIAEGIEGEGKKTV